MFYPVPGHESVIRIPGRMISFLRSALDRLEALSGPDTGRTGRAKDFAELLGSVVKSLDNLELHDRYALDDEDEL